MASRFCSSIICPRVSNAAMPDVVPTQQFSKDSSGHGWCNYCQKQRQLMDWAAQNDWPSVRVQGKMRYAIHGGKEDWFTSIVGASSDMVSALHETLILGKREQLPPIDWSQAKEE